MINSTVNNPLSKHFRQPSIYIHLPSGGRFYSPGSIELSVTGEFPIYPMTIKDEISFKTPDALMSGQGLADVIVSCCPNIKNPWVIPLPDLDPLLIAIRIASYGAGMDITTNCPHCTEINEDTIDLRVLLDSVKQIADTNQTEINNLIFTFKPQTFKHLNSTQIIAFQQQKILSIITDSDLSEDEKQIKFKESFDKLTDLNVESLINSIESIIADGIKVTDEVLIKDFMNNTDRKTYELIKKSIEDYIAEYSMDPVNLKCHHCEKEYQTKLEFNQSNFFG